MTNMTVAFNEGIETSVLSCIFKDGSLYSIVEDILERNMFGHPPFGIVYQSICDIVSNDLYPDSITICADLDRKGILDRIYVPSKGLRGREAIDFIAKMEVNKENIESYAYQVSEMFANTQLVELAKDIEEGVKNGKRPIEILSHMDLQAGKISAHVGGQSKNIRSAKDVAEKSVEQFEEAMGGKDLYIPTKIKAWDDFTGGLYPGRTYMVAAMSNDGKSTLVLDIAKNVCVEDKVKTFLLSFESSAEELNNKFVQILTGIHSQNIEKGKLLPSDVEPFKSAIKMISSSPLIYDDSSELSIAMLRTKVRKAVAEGAKLIIIDQLEQLFISNNDNQAEHIKLNYMSYRIKAIARENSVPIIIVHQTNKSAESGQNRGKNVDSQLGDINQGGQKACDAILIIRHQKENQEIIKSFFDWVKNRQSQKGRRQVKFIGSRLLFRDLTKEEMNSDEPEFTKGA
jgi:replicative DNA helicase